MTDKGIRKASNGSWRRAGDFLVDSIVADLAEQHLTPDARELELLAKARVTANRIEELEKRVARQETYTDKFGVVRPSPLLAEIRLQTDVLRRLLSGVQMSPTGVLKNPVKQRAGKASWAARSARQERGAIFQ